MASGVGVEGGAAHLEGLDGAVEGAFDGGFVAGEAAETVGVAGALAGDLAHLAGLFLLFGFGGGRIGRGVAWLP